MVLSCLCYRAKNIRLPLRKHVSLNNLSQDKSTVKRRVLDRHSFLHVSNSVVMPPDCAWEYNNASLLPWEKYYTIYSSPLSREGPWKTASVSCQWDAGAIWLQCKRQLSEQQVWRGTVGATVHGSSVPLYNITTNHITPLSETSDKSPSSHSWWVMLLN